ncbi:hypothetical protein RGUI_4049 [Rhodovulum sp. P5]|uniref:hypothetical protein n=1 Tax=Rhodovulum sp. P5 TaxID=1564506 RepID=UPI0009C2157E|nr:hypothetical protein [Rhodovulum sp. P5]ARE42190.1 hypothetical protein RGUI_4049 [Rhodovulum sp. P5]
MEPNKTYKRRAGTVRSEARAHLAEIRKARMARRKPEAAEKDHVALRAAAPVTQPAHDAIAIRPSATPRSFEHTLVDPAPTPCSDSVEATGLAEPAVEETKADTGEVAATASAAAGVDEAPLSNGTTDGESGEGDDPLASSAPEDAPKDSAAAAKATVLPDSEPDAVDGASPDMPEEAAPEEPAEPALDSSSDLFDLPGAGSGLVWMLQNAGVATMRDLAAADADALSERLGLIGQILDIGHWIDFAKSQVTPKG